LTRDGQATAHRCPAPSRRLQCPGVAAGRVQRPRAFVAAARVTGSTATHRSKPGTGSPRSHARARCGRRIRRSASSGPAGRNEIEAALDVRPRWGRVLPESEKRGQAVEARSDPKAGPQPSSPARRCPRGPSRPRWKSRSARFVTRTMSPTCAACFRSRSTLAPRCARFRPGSRRGFRDLADRRGFR